MRCPFCGAYEDKVIETRVSRDGSEIRRRRECEGCSRRYTTYERIEESMPLVIKTDGRREPFDRAKIAHGVQVAVAKRPVAREQVSNLALEVEREIGELGVAEIPAREIGERVLPRLRVLDQVAYVRFASIYRDFRDISEFERELDALRAPVVGEGAGLESDTGRHELAELAGDATIDSEQAREDTDQHALSGERVG